jgi:hypothetical protein
MTTLNQTQIAQALSQAGFTAAEIPTAYAIIMAESGGNPNAHNSTPPDDSYGLAQINMYGSLGPARRKQFGITSNAALYDVATNLKAMHAIYKSSGWNAWSTYKSGAYKKYVPSTSEINAILAGLGIGFTAGGLPGVGTIVGAGQAVSNKLDVGGAIAAVGEKLFTGIADFLGVMVALALLVVGVLILARKSDVVKNAGAAAGTAAKVAVL